MISLEGHITQSAFLSGLDAVMSTYYTFNLQHQHSAAYTLEFIQRLDAHILQLLLYAHSSCEYSEELAITAHIQAAHDISLLELTLNRVTQSTSFSVQCFWVSYH